MYCCCTVTIRGTIDNTCTSCANTVLETNKAIIISLRMITTFLSKDIKILAHREIEWVDFKGKAVNLRVKADVFRLVQN